MRQVPSRPQLKRDPLGSRVPGMDPRWSRLQRLHRWTMGLWLGWLPLGVLMISLQDRILPSSLVVIVLLTYMAAFGITGWVLAFAACPNCDQPFLVGRFRLQVPWALHCSHCNARIGDPIASRPGRS